MFELFHAHHLQDKPNADNERLLKTINSRGKIYVVPTVLNDVYVIRFVVCSRFSTLDDIKFAWKEIQDAAAESLHA